LTCLKTPDDPAAILPRTGIPMAKLPVKALLAFLTVNRSRRERLNWDQIVITSSIVVTIGLIALFAYGKATSRW
jgi:hypothetical protein